MQNDFMREKPVLPLVLSMSLPMTLSMLVNSLYNIVDSYFVARISEESMTALSLIYPLQILITAVGVGFGIGLNAMASYYLGAKQNDEANRTASAGVMLSIVHGIFLTMFCILVVPHFLRLFTQDPMIIQNGLTYSFIVFAFCVPHSLGVAFEKIFQAEGQMLISMISMLGGCVANIILDPILIFGTPFTPAMGIAGAAVATGIGETLPILIYLFFYWTKPLPIKLIFRKHTLNRQLCKKIYSISVPAAITIALPSLLITVLNGILASFSQAYVLILGIYYKLQTFIYLTTSGIVQGIRPIVGYNYGAKEYARVRAIFATALKLTLGVMTVGTMICLFFSDELIGLFTKTPETIKAGGTALRMISCGFIVSAISVTVSGTLEGLGRGMDSLKISLLRYVVAIIPLSYLLSRVFGAMGVWYSFGISEAVTSLVAVWIYRKVKLSE